MNKLDVVSLGELLIDFMRCGESEQGHPIFEANPGGAVVNVLAMLAKLGRKTAFIGKVGADMFGRQLADALDSCAINVDGLIHDPNANTTLAFVSHTPDGERDFAFFRKPGADTLLRPDEVNPDIIANSKIFHFGTLSRTNEPAKSATEKAIDLAKEYGKVISFDPNLRPPLWESLDEAKRQIAWGCALCDVIKISDDELVFLTGKDDSNDGIDYMRKHFPQIKLILLTKGSHGSEAFWAENHAMHPGFRVKAIDTTGAGDSFFGACLSQILDCGLDKLEQSVVEEMLRFANAAASIVTTRKGALLSMPSYEEISKVTS